MTRRCAPMGIEAASAVARRGASRAGQLLSVPVGPRDYERGRRDASADGVDASFGPSAVLRSVWTSHGEADASPPLAHTRRSRAHPLAASATTIHGKGNFAGTGTRPDCSVIPGTPSPEQSGQIPGGFHERMRETTTCRGPRTELAGLKGRTWPTTSQSKSIRSAAKCCLTVADESAAVSCST